jgi:hypothetical protein
MQQYHFISWQYIYLLSKPIYPPIIIPTYALADYELQLMKLYNLK